MYPTHPAEFTYHRPSSIDEALALLAELEDAHPLAGGHSLLPAMKIRLSTPAALVDIGRIPGLGAIERDGDLIMIGALATHAEVAASELVPAPAPCSPRQPR
jgi:aerobic carbon-monoxide dehydrogenase medium subunit